MQPVPHSQKAAKGRITQACERATVAASRVALGRKGNFSERILNFRSSLGKGRGFWGTQACEPATVAASRVALGREGNFSEGILNFRSSRHSLIDVRWKLRGKLRGSLAHVVSIYHPSICWSTVCIEKLSGLGCTVHTRCMHAFTSRRDS